MAKKTRRKKVKRRRTRKKKAGQPSEEEKEMLDWMPDLYVPPTPPRGSPHLTPETSSSLFYRSQPLVDPAWGWGGQFGKHSFLVSSDPPYTDSKGVEHSRKSPFNGLFWSNQNQYLANILRNKYERESAIIDPPPSLPYRKSAQALARSPISYFFKHFRLASDFLIDGHVFPGLMKAERCNCRKWGSGTACDPWCYNMQQGISILEILREGHEAPEAPEEVRIYRFGPPNKITRCIQNWVTPEDCDEIKRDAPRWVVRFNNYSSREAYERGEMPAGKLTIPDTIRMMLTGRNEIDPDTGKLEFVAPPTGLQKYAKFLNWLASRFGPEYKIYLQPIDINKSGGSNQSIVTNVLRNQKFAEGGIHVDFDQPDIAYSYRYLPGETYEQVGRSLIFYVNIAGGGRASGESGAGPGKIKEGDCSTIVHFDGEGGRTGSCPFVNGSITYLDGSILHSFQAGICHRISFVYKIMILKLSKDAPTIAEKEMEIFNGEELPPPPLIERRHSFPDLHKIPQMVAEDQAWRRPPRGDEID